MTTPAANTPYGIIADAMQDSGYLQDGQLPNSEQLAKNFRRLVDLVAIWQTEGLKLWLQTDQAITLVAGTVSYTVAVGSVKGMRVQQGYYLDVNDNSRPIYPLAWQEWLTLSNRTQEGSVTQFFIDKRTTSMVVSFWLVPDTTAATGTAHLLVQRQIAYPIALTEAMEFPDEWRMALRWGLADDISTGQPQAIMDRCMMRAQAYKAALEAWDVEDAETRFQPDSRMGMASSFRS